MQQPQRSRVKKIALIGIGGLIAFGLTGAVLETSSLIKDAQPTEKATTFKDSGDKLFLNAEPAKILKSVKALANNQPVDFETTLEQDENTMMLNNIVKSESIDDEEYLVVGCGGFL